MTPEQESSNTKNGRISNLPQNPQWVINNLVHAVEKGAIGAQYLEGEYCIYPKTVVDKDAFVEMTYHYEKLLARNGVPKKDVRGKIEDIKTRFYAGTPVEQSETFYGLTSILDSLNYNK